MDHTERLRRSPLAFRRLTGITPAAFDRPPADLTPRRRESEARRKDRPGRGRRPGAGRGHAPPLSDRLPMLLICCRARTTHALLGSLFGVDDAAAGRDINPPQAPLAGAFRIPERRIRLGPEEIRGPSLDATGRPTRRPEAGRRAYHSGERGRRTIEARAVVARRTKPPGPGQEPRRLRIAAVSEPYPGGVHDEKVRDRTRAACPPDARRTGDTARLGTPPETPARKPGGGELTAARKERDRRVSRRRIAAQDGIGKMKVRRIASERYRDPNRCRTPIMRNVAGLHDLMSA